MSALRNQRGKSAWPLLAVGGNAKVAQTLAGHYSASFTLGQYADGVPQQLEEAGEKV